MDSNMGYIPQLINALSSSPAALVTLVIGVMVTFIMRELIRNTHITSALAETIKARHDGLDDLSKAVTELRKAVDAMREEGERQASHRTRLDRIIDEHSASIEGLQTACTRHSKEVADLRESFIETLSKESEIDHRTRHA